MRAVIQRVSSSSVTVDGRIVSEIGPGLLVLIGIHESDTESDADYICRKVLNMRLFSNETTGKGWDQNVSFVSMNLFFKLFEKMEILMLFVAGNAEELWSFTW
jgi:D-tyrosyl-tRNA(Tyr) deacylase